MNNYDDNNIFAKILRGDIPNDTVFENEYVLAFKDISPQAPIHIVVIPKGKYISIADFGVNADVKELERFWRSISNIAKEQGLEEKGFRIITNSGENGSQQVPHFHVHILGGEYLGPLLAR